MHKGFAHAAKQGLVTADQYLFNGKQGECVFDSDKVAVRTTGMVQEKHNSNERIKYLVSHQPIAVSMVATDMLRFYKAGILTEEFLHCSQESAVPNHGVAIVGYGKPDKSDVASVYCPGDYWVVRNTFGEDWGESGYFRLCMEGTGSEQAPYGTCQVNKYPAYPTMKSYFMGQEETMS